MDVSIQTEGHIDSETRIGKNKKKKRKKKEMGKMLKEPNILPVLRLYGKHALCTNCLESSPWPIGDCGRNPCPFIERRLSLETPRGNCQQFLRNAFRGISELNLPWKWHCHLGWEVPPAIL